MKKAAAFITDHRRLILPVMFLFTLVCVFLSFRVPINTDMTKYLPDDSAMKQGLDIMMDEFSSLSMPSSIRLMFDGLTPARQEEILDTLSSMEGADSAVLTAEKDGHTLYTVTTSYDYRTPEEQALEAALKDAFPGETMVLRNDDANGMAIPLFIYVVAVVLLLVILFCMCGSWVEPFVFLTVIGMAILINSGTNLILGSVSQNTYSISAILQLVLSMDYSIILMNRYRQEKKALASAAGSADAVSPAEAMKRAFVSAFPSITSSAFTTFVGLLMLVFMRFKIGKDIGLVLAKGVFWSMLCVLTILPGLIVIFDRLITKTEKRVVPLPTGGLASFAWRFRYVLMAGFVFLFAASYYMQTRSETSYSLSAEDPIADIFPPENPVIVLYENGDEDKVAALCADLVLRDDVAGVDAYSTTLGKQMTAEEMYSYLTEQMQGGGSFAAYAARIPELEEAMNSFDGTGMDLSGEQIRALYLAYSLTHGGNASGTLSLEDIALFVADRAGKGGLIAAMLDDSVKDRISLLEDVLAAVKGQLVGPDHSFLRIRSALPVESEETAAFLDVLDEQCRADLSGEYYLIGNSPMNREMKGTFHQELTFITLLTFCAIFLIVALTFRSLVIPLLLSCVVQCGVFLTITTTWLLGYPIYYLANVIVQCILMGSTVDYAILFTNYYREMRMTMDPAASLRESYARSIRTILTSALFMFLATAVIGNSPADPTITQICQTISIGAASATLLILFVLPGMLAALDRFICRRSK